MKAIIRIDFHNHWVNKPGYETEIKCRILPILNIIYWNHEYGYISIVLRSGWLFWPVTLSFLKPPLK